ncbi:uncharacterized protein LOC122653939 [Telopea speciosissima]|uniref:uncharacterized protein LOC122653939 n=1 Tax=Telopea speciosissima TaxID=54955 RepID=UPI001CC62024|nr:uncharacterized protein LOC122653939 [Telopea speciosissima]
MASSHLRWRFQLLSNQRDYQMSFQASSCHSHEWEMVPIVVWKRIWGCKSLPKVKNFLWRICAQGLAYGDNLSLPMDPSYRRCGATTETIDHIILGFSFARATTFSNVLPFLVPNNDSPSVIQLLKAWDQVDFTNKREEKKVLSLFLFICWSLWTARNDLIFNAKEWTSTEVFSKAQKCYREFWLTYANSTNPLNSTFLDQNSNNYWKPQQAQVLKLNYNATFPLDESGNDIGGIIHPLSSEALAILVGLQTTIENEAQIIEVESDNADLISYISNSCRSHPITISNIIGDIRLLASRLCNGSFGYINRDANMVDIPLRALEIVAPSK